MSQREFASVARAVAFGASISLSAFLTRACGDIASISADVPLRPPPWVFGVVWPCLYITTGIAWVRAGARAGARADRPLAGITALCCWWLVAYVCLRQKAVAALTLGLTALTTLATAIMLGSAEGWLLVPLALWTAFATYLNTADALR